MDRLIQKLKTFFNSDKRTLLIITENKKQSSSIMFWMWDNCPETECFKNERMWFLNGKNIYTTSAKFLSQLQGIFYDDVLYLNRTPLKQEIIDYIESHTDNSIYVSYM